MIDLQTERDTPDSDDLWVAVKPLIEEAYAQWFEQDWCARNLSSLLPAPPRNEPDQE